MTTEKQDVSSQTVEQNAQIVQETCDNTATEACMEKNDQLRKQKKNCFALIILLGGFACGSLFIDVVQLFAQKGFSARAIKDAQVVEYDGATWVRYDDPKITVDVYDADDCTDCVTDEVLVRLRSYIPTLEAHRIDVRTEEGRQIAQQEQIVHIPAFVFSKNVDESDFYQQAAILFRDNGEGKYFFDTPSVGVPIGEYLEKPSADSGVQFGKTDAPITIVAYENPISDESRMMFPIIDKISSEFTDQVRFVIKVHPEKEQKNSMQLAQAIICASEQGKYQEFMKLVNTEHRTIASTDKLDEKFNVYIAKLGMEGDQFHACTKEDRVADLIEQNIQEAIRFGVVVAPTYFVGQNPVVGVTTYETLKAQIEELRSSGE